VRILFSTQHFAGFRNFESVVRLLAERGHTVILVAEETETFGGQALVERLAAEYPDVTWTYAPSLEDEPWFPVAQKMRFALEYVRFLDPRYREAVKLRLRNRTRAPRLVRWLTPSVGRVAIGSGAVAAGLKWIERLLPCSNTLASFIESQAPDVMLLTSVTVARSTQMDQLKIARARGIPVAACIMSWDHLSSKALVHIAPDLTLVWNEVQRREAVDLHGLAADRVAVTGAQCYDQWFGRQPARTRDEFCRAVGLDPSRPFVLYVCSTMSPPPSPLEPLFVKQWVEALRASAHPSLRDAGVLVRPHPERVKEWQGVNLDGLGNVVVHGRTPLDEGAKSDYFDSLCFSEAVVGLCTSAFLEAAIAGRAVLTLQLPAYRIHQEGMAHFRYLLDVEGGLLHTASDLAQHLTQLAAVLADHAAADERTRRFLTAFVRPRGLGVPATLPFVEAVEQLARDGRRAPDARLGRSSWLPNVVQRLAAAGRAGIGRWLLMDEIDIARVRSERESERYKATLVASRAVARAQEQRERESGLRAKTAIRRSKEWSKWRRGLSAKKQIARFKGGVKHLIGARHQ
jgi:hypothetical protein